MKKIALFIFSILLLIQCKENSEQSITIAPDKDNSVSTIKIGQLPSWAKNATIYEVNVRQFTPEGTFKAFQKHLPRLKKMNVDILWLMPIFPISQKNRKGSLGSPYAVSDYNGINEEFGSMADFKELVTEVHKQGMYIILDFVPNHTGWDSPWISDHPEWFTQDSLGNVIDPIDPGTGKSWGWTDVADLNFDNNDMRQAMIQKMLFWINEADIDGYRMDVAHNVPQDFWDAASKELFGAKEIFMLAEAEVPSHLNSKSFHSNYGWSLHHEMNKLSKKEIDVATLITHVVNHPSKHENGFPINFTSNHDENTWNGTVFERMGDAHKPLAVFAATVQGMPLLYGGQEEPIKHRLKFFEKDEIGFNKFTYEDFYTTLFELKHNNQALWNGVHGDQDPTWFTENKEVISFLRTKNKQGVFVAINPTDKKQDCIIGTNVKGNEVFENKEYTLKKGDIVSLPPYAYKVISIN